MNEKIKKTIKRVAKRTYPYFLYRAKGYFKKIEPKIMQLEESERYSTQKPINQKREKVRQIAKCFEMAEIRIDPNCRFQYWIDTGIYLHTDNFILGNTTPYYPLIVFSSIEDIIKSYDENVRIGKQNIQLLRACCRYIKRIVAEIDDELENCISEQQIYNLEKAKNCYERMITSPSCSFEDALQRILFWSSLFWQTGHYHVGLGRLDKILGSFDIPKNAIEIISDFYKSLHKFAAFKSDVTLGDTGQIIILGGIEKDGSYFCNKLTYLFIDSLMCDLLPDPKLLLRVSAKMPDDLLKRALECIATGVGCPLLSNDDVVIDCLKDFVYFEDDAFDYVTAACWEPVISGKSLDVGNMQTINFAKPLYDMWFDDDLMDSTSFKEVLNVYFKHLRITAAMTARHLDEIVWEADPFYTLFTSNCYCQNKDISEGGAEYNNFGITTVGLSSTVDSLAYIKRHVFLKNETSLAELKDAVLSESFDGETRERMRNERIYGRDKKEAVELTQVITEELNRYFASYSNQFDGRIKWGLSSPSYVVQGNTTPATLDGRSSGDPLATHISAPQGSAYTELINFASSLDYAGAKSNGNVIDFFMSPYFMNNHIDKIVSFIKSSIKIGFFQMQINVVDSKTLIDAKKHPELHKNLIVRVWGFSTYFNDLPSDYQDVLIERALASEQVAA